MSFYRTILAAAAAIAIASPVLADDTAAPAADANQAMQVSDNTQTTTTNETTTTTTTTETKINLNTASAKDLMKIKGLNAAKSRAIVAYRKKHGSFKTTDDLSNVKGFKKMDSDALKSIEDQLTVE